MGCTDTIELPGNIWHVYTVKPGKPGARLDRDQVALNDPGNLPDSGLAVHSGFMFLPTGTPLAVSFTVFKAQL